MKGASHQPEPRGLGAVVAAFVVTLAAGGCRTVGSVASQVRIVGGEALTADNPGDWSAVAYADAHGRIFCTGVLVAPDLVLTAAHCLKSRSPEFVIFESVGQPERVRRRVITFKSHPDHADGFNFDVGWIRFEGPPPEPFKPVPILPDPKALAGATPVTLVGYGQTGTSVGDGGKRKLTTGNRVHKVVDHRFVRGVLLLGPNPGHGACFGDSGGPAYVKVGDQWRLAGITQGAGANLAFEYPEPPDDSCETGADAYVLAARFAPWIAASSGVMLAGTDVAAGQPEFATQTPDQPDFKTWCAEAPLTREVFKTLFEFLYTQKTFDCGQGLLNYAKTGRLELTLGPASGNDARPLLSLPPPRVLKVRGSYELADLAVFRTGVEDLTLINLGQTPAALAEFKKLRRLTISVSPPAATAGTGYAPPPPWQTGTFAKPPVFVEDLRWLAALRLESLHLENLGVRSLAGLESVTGTLTDLTLTNPWTENSQALAALAGLRELSISEAPALDFKAIAGMRELRTLSVRRSMLRAAPFLRGHPATFDKVSLAENLIENVDDVVTLRVSELNLPFNKIGTAAPLGANQHLRMLNMMGNPLVDPVCPIPKERGYCDMGAGGI